MSLISPTPSLNGLITKKLQTYTTPINKGSPEKEGEEKGSLFKPLKSGEFRLNHRVVMCPLTRHRADKHGVHSELAEEYYEQRASKGGLIITEGTLIAEEAGGEAFVPGIYSNPQIKAWKKITEKVHEKVGKIFCQLWALGRVADPSLVSHIYAPSDIPHEGSKVPIGELTQEDIDRFKRFPELGYIHVIESDRDADSTLSLREIVGQRGNGTVFISSGEYAPGKAKQVVEELGGMVGFGRYFISNPDLPLRIQHNLPLNHWDERTFYTQGAEGYIDYPSWEESKHHRT